MRLLTLGLGAALGYFLGSSEGRQNLDKMTQNAQKLWNDPKTQEKVGHVQDAAQQKFAEVKDEVKTSAQDLKENVQKDGLKDALKGEDKAGRDGSKDEAADQQVTVSNNDNVPAANATGADPDIISDPSTALGDEGPTAR